MTLIPGLIPRRGLVQFLIPAPLWKKPQTKLKDGKILKEIGSYKQGWFFSILWCSQTGDYSQEDLAKFGYRPDVKVSIFINPFVFWLLTRHCCRFLANFLWNHLHALRALEWYQSNGCASGLRDLNPESTLVLFF